MKSDALSYICALTSFSCSAKIINCLHNNIVPSVFLLFLVVNIAYEKLNISGYVYKLTNKHTAWAGVFGSRMRSAMRQTCGTDSAGRWLKASKSRGGL